MVRLVPTNKRPRGSFLTHHFPVIFQQCLIIEKSNIEALETWFSMFMMYKMTSMIKSFGSGSV